MQHTSKSIQQRNFNDNAADLLRVLQELGAYYDLRNVWVNNGDGDPMDGSLILVENTLTDGSTTHDVQLS